MTMKKVNPRQKVVRPTVRISSVRGSARVRAQTKAKMKTGGTAKKQHANPNPFKTKLDRIHSRLKFQGGGTLKQEYPEQLLTLQYLPKTAKVLEIGGNLGRNSLIISTVLENDKNFVTLECDPRLAKRLTMNRNLNNRHFHIEASALSKAKLFQKGWQTYSEANKPDGAFPIATILWADLQKKYHIPFDTLIADCEGALYYILTDFPDFLDDINLIIVENDYKSMSHKQIVDELFINKGFSLLASRPGPHHTPLPCKKQFYQVWKKSISVAVESAESSE